MHEAAYDNYITCLQVFLACPFTTSPHLDRLDVYLEQCRLAFNMTPGAIADNVAWSNVRSGGRSPGVDRVLWVQGDVDPWFPLGVTEGDDLIMVPDASHHFWTHVAKHSDQPSVPSRKTRASILQMATPRSKSAGRGGTGSDMT